MSVSGCSSGESSALGPDTPVGLSVTNGAAHDITVHLTIRPVTEGPTEREVAPVFDERLSLTVGGEYTKERFLSDGPYLVTAVVDDGPQAGDQFENHCSENSIVVRVDESVTITKWCWAD